MKQICTLPEMSDVRSCYFVTDCGAVLSCSNHAGGDTGEFKALKPALKQCGYLYYGLMRNDGSIKTVRAHKLVALAFCEGYAPNLLIHHRNGCKTDNRAINLEWIAAKDHCRLESSKPMFCYNKQGELVKSYKYAIDALKDGFGMHAFRVACEKEREHKGFVFSYKPLTKREVFQRLSKSYLR